MISRVVMRLGTWQETYIGTRATGCDRAERSSGHESRGSHEHGDAKGPGFHFHGSLFFDPVLVLLFCRLTLLMFRV
jgi:hypothetical protein